MEKGAGSPFVSQMPRQRWPDGGATLQQRRSSWEVVSDILAVGSGTKTDFLYEARLNSRQLNKYLGLLLDKGLLVEAEPERGRAIYQVTAQGNEVLARLREIIDLLGMSEAGEFDDLLAHR